MTNVSPRDIERFHLKLILNHKVGVKNFSDLKTHNNKIYNTFREAADAMGLIENDEHIYKIFDEACSLMIPRALRSYFVWFLLADQKAITCNLWMKYKMYLCEDFKDDRENRALIEIQKLLSHENLTNQDVGLPDPSNLELFNINDNNSITLQNYSDLAKKYILSLNRDQKIIFDYINNDSEVKCIFIDGPGGTGKTFLYNALIYNYLSQNISILSMAWTGIASILLPGGSTSHKIFRLPFDIKTPYRCNLKNNAERNKIKNCQVIIWDECSMIPKEALEFVDKTLREVCEIDSPFGGKLIIIGGDFRQILPVVKFGAKNEIIESCLKSSHLWHLFKKFSLKINIRNSDEIFQKFLLDIGEYKIQSFVIPEMWLTNDICKKIYDIDIAMDPSASSKIILCSHNEDVDRLNQNIINMMQTKPHIYYSIDYITSKGTDIADEKTMLKYPIEQINHIKIPTLPNHKLILKVGAIVILLRNICVSNGMCNGTRLRILALYEHNIKAEILTGTYKNSEVYIPRILINSGDEPSLPFILNRRQFPIALAFVITLNKAQGQSFDKVGIYYNKEYFTHGQLYVGLSRVKNSDSIYIQNDSSFKEIKNIVWPEILD